MARRTFTEPEAFHRVLSHILQAARERGMDEAELARRAGSSPETLSRMKSRKNGDFGLLAKMAKVVGLRITAVPDSDTREKLHRGDFF